MAELTAPKTTGSCCAPKQQATCCEPSEKADCCGHGDGCGCDARTAEQAGEESPEGRQIRATVAANSAALAERPAKKK